MEMEMEGGQVSPTSEVDKTRSRIAAGGGNDSSGLRHFLQTESNFGLSHQGQFDSPWPYQVAV